MAHHESNEPPTVRAVGKGDRAIGPLYLDGLVPRAILERMQHYTEQVYERGHGDKRGMDEASEVVIRTVQRELRRLEPGPVDRLLAFELVTAELWALHPIFDGGGAGAAKRAQVRLADGRPLAICRGTATGRLVNTRHGTFTVHGEGCLHIFEAPDHTTGGHMFPHQCPDCRPRNGKRNPLRTSERAFRARLRLPANG
jgi:hypothetical protein